MEEVETEHRGFVVAVVIFWFLAAGFSATAFVFHQTCEGSRIRAERMNAERGRVVDETVSLERKVETLRTSLDSDAQTDKAALDSVRAAVGQAPHVDGALVAADLRISDLGGHVEAHTATKTALEERLAAVQKERQTADDTFSAKIKQIEARITELTNQIEARVGQLSGQLAALTSKIDACDAHVKSTRDAALEDRVKYETSLKILLPKRRELKDQLRVTLQFRPRIVGRVLVADLRLDFAFVNLGREHGVWEGLRFSVYPPDVVFRPNLKPKATLEINRVEDRRSQARIIKQTLGDPVVSGDLLVNIAFEAEGPKPTFALVRFLDVDGDNVDDRVDIIKLIRRQGGEVLRAAPEDVTVDTDFILMGADWDVTDPKQQSLETDRDTPIVDKAQRRSVTQLDVETFLNYIGFPKWR